MNSLKRERQDRATLVDNQFQCAVIRSHRKRTPPGRSRTIAGVLVLSALVTFAVAGSVDAGATMAPEDPNTPAVAIAEALEIEQPTRERVTRHERTDRARVPAPRPRPKSRARVTSKIDIVINTAMAQLGKPYRWGAAGPRAYDCSGLIIVAYSRVGIYLPHYSMAILKYGRRVSQSELRRGDIISPQFGHVGIYLGNGHMIHASSSARQIVIAEVWRFYAAVRLIG